tara:strand:- start:1120 stop:1908 length:789 start_codon:yes stop_codon:yes gene_type:complete
VGRAPAPVDVDGAAVGGVRGCAGAARVELCDVARIVIFFVNRQEKGMEDVCRGSVAVVGNGPITISDRDKINSEYDCVVRFNDMKNYKNGDALTLHVSRLTNEGFFPGTEKSDASVPFLPVASDVYLVHNNDSLQSRSNVLTPVITNKKTNAPPLFGGCVACGGEVCHHGQASYGPSTGALALSELDRSNAVQDIHVYGMNWNGASYHVDFKYPDLVANCCSKCTIHPTANANYDDRNMIDRVVSSWPRRIDKLKRMITSYF